MDYRSSSIMWEDLLGAVMHWREGATSEHGSPQAARWRRIRPALRRGNSEATEYYAYPYVFPYCGSDATTYQRVIVLRLTALVAEYQDIPVFSAKTVESQDGNKLHRRSLGQWCNLVSRKLAPEGDIRASFDPSAPDAVASRLMYLHTQNAEEAISSIRRIMNLAAKLDSAPALDFRDLFATFIFWGNGVSESSRRHRRKILEDYYSGFPPSDENRD